MHYGIFFWSPFWEYANFILNEPYFGAIFLRVRGKAGGEKDLILDVVR